MEDKDLRPRLGRLTRWLIALAVTIAAGLMIVTGLLLKVDRWGALGEWLGAVGTIAAVWTALHIANREAALTSARALAEARERDQRAIAEARERDERERSDALARAVRVASLVLAEVLYTSAADADLTTPEATVRIANHGPEPILLPRLERFQHPAGGRADWTFDDPAGQWEDYRAPEVLGPGGVNHLPVSITYDPELSATEWRKLRSGVPIISYTDATGRRWRRVGTATPVEIEPENDEDGNLAGGPDWYRITLRPAGQAPTPAEPSSVEPL